MDSNFYLIAGGLLVLALLILLRRQSSPPTPASFDKDSFVPKELYVTIAAQNETLRRDLATKEQEIRDSYAQLAARDQAVLHLETMLRTQKGEVEQLQARFKTEFENIANRLLEEKSQRFTVQNTQHLQSILSPLREKIKEFEENVDRKFLEDTREKASLKVEIGHLRDLNQQLSQDAHNLTSALKGQNKVQGNWGEMQLEVLLEKAGLTKHIHFQTQASFRNDDGHQKRPDFIIQLPDNKHLVVDAKVSLTAFERYHNAEDAGQRDLHLRSHIASIRSHVD
ncbi:MAG: DNA recombination protein RmuC, partial [Saprospiraceae bacterium]|nr:DNA recombination protein RmuC [Saprospiraceae bacterium]